jgi:hypothetical protein
MNRLRKNVSALPRFFVTLFPNFVTGQLESSAEVIACERAIEFDGDFEDGFGKNRCEDFL